MYRTIPALPNSYKYVLIREDRNPDLLFTERMYEEVIYSQPIEYKGKKVCAIFPNSKNSVDRLTKLGWRNITEDFKMEQYLRNKKEGGGEKINLNAPEPIPANQSHQVADGLYRGKGYKGIGSRLR